MSATLSGVTVQVAPSECWYQYRPRTWRNRSRSVYRRGAFFCSVVQRV